MFLNRSDTPPLEPGRDNDDDYDDDGDDYDDNYEDLTIWILQF